MFVFVFRDLEYVYLGVVLDDARLFREWQLPTTD